MKQAITATKGAKAALSVALFSLMCWGAIAQKKAITFSPNLYNIENTSDETFRYTATLKNSSDEAKTFALEAGVPEGWRASFKVRGSSVRSLKVDKDKTESISIELKPAHECKPNTYKIPVTAKAENEDLSFTLEAVVKGSYEVALSTPSGRLSGKVVEGEKMEFALKVTNTGTLPLSELDLSARTPSKWEASFEPETIENLQPGKSTEVKTTLTVPEKTLPGDYITKFTIKNTESRDTAEYRVTVETSVLAGWVGILVIVIAVGIVFFLIRKFGRR
ncbi:COG1470 family protein [Marinoscillum furvescens]|uniref:COG1470 family protein n=1 Tax=Marinoscillum furvescens TaxID=1026 RepID=UPI001C87397E|nr:NEW3 domain-containing protein [Marinoscillum furvescens]